MILEVRNIVKRFGGIVALDGPSFALDQGEVLGLIGPNGSGKTTIFNVITGLYRPESGQVLFDGEDITGQSIHRIARLGVSRTFQATRLFFNLTVRRNLQTVCEACGQANPEELIAEVLDRTGLTERGHSLAAELTSAEQRLLMIGLGLTLSPRALLLDEPTAGMNMEEVRQTLDIIAKIRDQGCAVLIIEHNMRAVTDICDRCVVLSYGKLIAQGLMKDIQRDPRVIEAYLGED